MFQTLPSPSRDAPSRSGRTATRAARRGGARRLIAAACLSLTLSIGAASLGTPAFAHELRPAVADLGRDGVAPPDGDEGRLSVRLRVNVEAMIADIGIEHDDTDDSPQAATYDALRGLEPDRLRDRLDVFLPTLLDALELRTDDGERLPLALVDAELPPVGDVAVARDSVLLLAAPLPSSVARLTWHWPARFGPVIVRSTEAEGPAAFSVYLLAGETSAPLPLDGSAGADADAAGSPSSTVLTYLRVGFVHIVPLGLDHILFVIGLFLFSPRARPVIAQVTAFTVAHSVTLALASLGVVTVPARIVEPLIALSIVAVCVENLLGGRLGRGRLAIVFGFGLLHGLGFASVLEDVGTGPSAFLASLVAFNVGVELGQLAVVLACFACVGWWFRDAPWYRRVVTVPGSVAIGAVGLYWFVERLVS